MTQPGDKNPELEGRAAPVPVTVASQRETMDDRERGKVGTRWAGSVWCRLQRSRGRNRQPWDRTGSTSAEILLMLPVRGRQGLDAYCT